MKKLWDLTLKEGWLQEENKENKKQKHNQKNP